LVVSAAERVGGKECLRVYRTSLISLQETAGIVKRFLRKNRGFFAAQGVTI
jgi:hypothetical protein